MIFLYARYQEERNSSVKAEITDKETEVVNLDGARFNKYKRREEC